MTTVQLLEEEEEVYFSFLMMQYQVAEANG